MQPLLQMGAIGDATMGTWIDVYFGADQSGRILGSWLWPCSKIGARSLRSRFAIRQVNTSVTPDVGRKRDGASDFWMDRIHHCRCNQINICLFGHRSEQIKNSKTSSGDPSCRDWILHVQDCDDDDDDHDCCYNDGHSLFLLGGSSHEYQVGGNPGHKWAK